MSMHSASPSDKPNVSRHVGEGALDDSDSSDDEEAVGTSEEDLMSPISGLPSSRITPVHPSPLSQLASRWTEDEDGKETDDASSPSPQSTDTDTAADISDSIQSHKVHRPKRTSLRKKSRSRSSTVASLPAPSALKSVIHQDSLSSIKTVVLVSAGASIRDGDTGRELKQEDTIRASDPSQSMNLAPDAQEERTSGHKLLDEAQPASQPYTIVYEEERKLREVAWRTLREALRDYGDIVSASHL